MQIRAALATLFVCSWFRGHMPYLTQGARVDFIILFCAIVGDWLLIRHPDVGVY
jgi:hypothetical protein